MATDMSLRERRKLPVVHAIASTLRAGPTSLRLSLTDRCDFACVYCRPSRRDGYVEKGLDPGARLALLRALRDAGVRRVRLTGGEPLVSPDVVETVAQIASLGFEDVALTTNASQLARLARPLREAGLRRVNVSLDTLDPARFREITRGGELTAVLAGIDEAIQVGLEPIKLNTVVLRGVNDDELERIVDYAWTRRAVPRFLEVMPIAEGARLAAQLVTASEMRARLASLVESGTGEVEAGLGPARYVRAKHDPTLRVGFISGTSDTFCADCDRLRLSSTGTLRPCLATDVGVSAAESARRGDASAIARDLESAWAMKPDGTTWKGCTESTAASVSIRAIGG